MAERDNISSMIMASVGPRIASLLDPKDDRTGNINKVNVDGFGNVTSFGIDNKLQDLAAGEAQKGYGQDVTPATPSDTPEQAGGPNYGVTRLLATLGSAFSAAEPQSWQAQLSKGVGVYAAGQQFKGLREGKEFKGTEGFGITPEERIAAERLGLMEKELGIRESRLKGDIKAPTSRQIRVGDEFVTQEFNPETGWTEIGRSPIREGQRPLLPKRETRIEGEDVVTYSVNPETGGEEEVSRGPRWQADQATFPEFSPTARQNFMESLYEDIKSAIPRGKVLGVGLGGKISIEDLNEMIRTGDIPEEASEVMDLINAYEVLYNRSDVTAQATDAPEELKAKVLDAMVTLGYTKEDMGIQEAPETGGTEGPKWFERGR